MPTPSAQDLLDAVNECILKRLSGDGYNGYTTGLGHQFVGASLGELYRLRNDLQDEINSLTGQSFHLAEPFSF